MSKSNTKLAIWPPPTDLVRDLGRRPSMPHHKIRAKRWHQCRHLRRSSLPRAAAAYADLVATPRWPWMRPWVDDQDDPNPTGRYLAADISRRAPSRPRAAKAAPRDPCQVPRLLLRRGQRDKARGCEGPIKCPAEAVPRKAATPWF